MTRNKNKIIRAVTVPQSLGFCREVMIKMRAMGYDMVAVTSPGPELDELRDKDGFHCVAVPMERHISIVNDLKSLMRMISVFRKEKPQMVHSMTPKAGMICMVAAWLTRVPVRIHTFTGLVWPTATGLKRKILMMTDWLTCACATHVIPEGQGVLNDLKNGGITKKPMKVLGYGNVRGVDMERFSPARFKATKNPDVFTFVFVGRIVGDKGINELVEAFVKLHDKHKNTRLVLVGKYEHELDPVSDKTRKLIDTNEGIVACGPKYGDDLLQMYVDADCFVMPSYREGFPNTVLEAGAMGLPSIVTDINGSREIIENEKNGLIVPSKNANALYDAMERMLTDDKAREIMKSNARQIIESRFEKNFVQKCQIEFYKRILN
ncbi:glycosyltransferase family 4 protein [Prevotella stercorea]|uniref:glycosyltransferase family 4 protein n=1 Tax=Leyella stercorea TaxID=363265 RepID=UPI001F20AD35|nr:glycosyltransferase family 4 protein [Leyella stercorea]MCF2578172.1 glycosyltransferase family 4 protein [Leyella stercorea]